MTPRPAQTELQLQAMAAAADRANRPGEFILVPLVALLAAVLFTIFSARTYLAERANLTKAAGDGTAVVELINGIRTEESKAIDPARLFPARQFFGSQILDCIKGDPESGIEPLPFKEPKPTVGDARSAPAPGAAAGINRTEIQCTVNNEPLDLIFQWIDQVLNHPSLKGQVFISSLRLQPVAPGWSATVTFALYEFKGAPAAPGSRR